MQLGFIQPFAPNSQKANWQTGSVHLQHNRRQGSLGKSSQIRHCQIGNLSDVRVGIRAGLEVNFDQAHTRQRPRFHVVHSARQREEPFKRIRNVGFDLLGRHAAIECCHQYYRDIDWRKHIHGHSSQTGQSQDDTNKQNTIIK